MICLGFELITGKKIEIPIRHTAVTGQTQESGKTTTLEAMIARSGLRAVGFVTKRGERSFSTGRVIPPYFREPSEGETGPLWQFVGAILEATLRERLKFQRAWIMKVCDAYRGKDGQWEKPKTLAQVAANIDLAMEKARGLNESIYRELREYFRIVLPQLETLPKSHGVHLEPGVNVMFLADYTPELQALIMRSVIEWIHEREEKTVCIIPEAWEFIPQERGSPVRYACERLIRQGAALQNYLWLDSQDIAGVHKNILRQIAVWIMGVQREIHEAERTLDHIPIRPKPRVEDVMRLAKGQFFVCHGETIRKVYVQPAWMNEATAYVVALGNMPAPASPKGLGIRDQGIEQKAQEAEEAMWKEKFEAAQKSVNQLTDLNESLTDQVKHLTDEIAKMQKQGEALRHAVTSRDLVINQGSLDKTPATPDIRHPTSVSATSDPRLPTSDLDSLYQYIRRRAQEDPTVLQILAQKPEIEVTVERVMVSVNGGTLRGRLAQMLAEGYFDQPKNGNTAFVELREHRGIPVAKPNVYRELDKLTEMGFLLKESAGYQSVEGMKVNIVQK